MANSTELGIDLGYSNIVIYEKDKGIIFDEPAVIAYNINNNHMIEFGYKAYNMIGKAPSDIEVLYPLRDINNKSEEAQELLRLCVKKATKKNSWFDRPKAIICFPNEAHAQTKELLIKVLVDVGMKKTQSINRAHAICFGASIPLDNRAKMIVEISSEQTNIYLTTMQKVIPLKSNHSVFCSGNSFTEAIRTQYKNLFLMDFNTAERVKHEIGTLKDINNNICVSVYGRKALSSLPTQESISIDEISKALKLPANSLYRAISDIYLDLNNEYAADIKMNGIYLSGGGALLNGLGEYLSNEIGIDVHISEYPQYDAVLGVGFALENPREVKTFLTT